jgi:hypothetical protein
MKNILEEIKNKAKSLNKKIVLCEGEDKRVIEAAAEITAQGIAQNVANAFRLFTNDAYFFTDQGIPHFIIELNAHPKINILRSRLKKVALQVEGVKDCTINLMATDEDRALNGYAELTLINGEKTTVAISGL